VTAVGAYAHQLRSRHEARLPYAAVMMAVTTWGFGPLLVKGIPASSLTIAFYRLWCAVPVMMLAARWRKTPLTLAMVRRSVPAGMLFVVSLVLGFMSYKATSVANATLIPAVQPVLIMLVAYRLFGERRTSLDIVFGAVSLVGVGAVVIGAGHAGGAHLKGDLYAVANLLVWTWYFLTVKRVRANNVPAFGFLAAVFLIGAIAVTPVTLLTSHDLGSLRGSDWLRIVALVLLPGLIGHGLMTWSQRHVDVTISSLLNLANPVISAAGAWWIFGQVLHPLQIVGAALVLAGLAAIVIRQQQAVPAEV
jgi:drug/metabolite transporter (DMT)-like permease